MNENKKLIPPIEPKKYNYEDDLEERRKNWKTVLKFKASSSEKFKQVFKFASSQPNFNKLIEEDGAESYALTYGADDMIQFKELYSKVKTWKGTEVTICGEIVDKKIISRFLACYIDYLKFNVKTTGYCYGVSMFTDNPFGCHRTKIHKYFHNAWYKYIKELPDGTIITDKYRIWDIIKENLKTFKYCPVINPKNILNGLLNLPDIIDLKSGNWTVKRENGVIELDQKLEIRI